MFSVYPGTPAIRQLIPLITISTFTPLLEASIKKRIRGMFNIMLSDNVKGRRMKPNGKYCKDEITGEAINSQEYFFEEAYGEHKVEKY